MNVDEFLNNIKKNNVIVFGVGFVSERFTEGLRKRGLEDCIKCYIVSQKDTDQFMSKPVIGLDEFNIQNYQECDRNPVICLAVHESNKDSVEKNLRKCGIEKYIWGYPFLHDLFMGDPIEQIKEVKVDSLIKKCRNDYRIAVRTLVIDEYYGLNNLGYGIYVKAQSAHCEPETAKRRLESFLELIKDWDSNGYYRNSFIKVTDENEVLDGVHRLSLAYYHGQKEIYADIYESSSSEGFINQDVMITQDVIQRMGLSDEEKKLLQTKHSLIYGDRVSSGEKL